MNSSRNKLKLMCFAVVILPLMIGCALRPVQKPTAKVVIYNDSAELWYGRDNSGMVAIAMDGRHIINLKRGKYITIEAVPGIHTVDLKHKDYIKCHSRHTVFLTANENNYLQINATPAANEAEITIKPADFDKLYSAAIY